MRVLVLSDVHSNLEALNAVLADAGGWDVIWSLGDIVGYGPQPNECIARLSAYPHVAIPGNHDWGVLGRIDLEDFNAQARLANLWTREQMNPISWAYLETLPERRVEGDWTLAHGSPRRPLWEYLLSPDIAQESFAHFGTSVCLVGHTHLPVIFRYVASQGVCQAFDPPEDTPVRLDQERYIINPGSVGQPRDGDARAAYLLLDTEKKSITHRRVSYAIAKTQEQMRAAKLPRHLIERLNMGW
jgi:predicted phosphodiesterase